MQRHSIITIATCTLLFAASHAWADPAPSAKERTAKLIAVLKSDAPQKDKADACRELAIVGTPDAVPVLAGLLGDLKLAHMARYGLEPIQDPSVDEALRAALAQQKGLLLVGVIGSIGVRRDAKATAALAGLLHDADPLVVSAAARSLGRIGTVEAGKALQDALPSAAPAGQLVLVEGLFRCGEALAAGGKSSDAQAIFDRLRGLASAPYQVRVGALRAAIHVRGKAGLPLLQESLNGADYIAFAGAVRTAETMKDAEVTLALTAALKAASADRRVVLLQAIGRRGDASAVPAVVGLVKNEAKPVALAAIQAAGQLGGETATAALFPLLTDADREVALLAQDCLSAAQGEKVDAAVIAMLASRDPAQVRAALELVGLRHIASALPTVMSLATGPDAAMRPQAIRRLGELGKIADLPKLLDLLLQAKGDADREAAGQTLATLCGRADDLESCTAPIAARLATAQPDQQAALLRVLAAVGGSHALEALRSALPNSNREVHVAAVRGLAGWKTPDAEPDLLRLAQSSTDGTDKLLALQGYLSWATKKETGNEKRLEMCRQAASLAQKPAEKKLLLSALGSIAHPQALKLIEPSLDDPAIRGEAGFAILSIAEQMTKRGVDANKAKLLTAPLEKIVQANVNPGLTKRATVILQQAKALKK